MTDVLTVESSNKYYILGFCIGKKTKLKDGKIFFNINEENRVLLNDLKILFGSHLEIENTTSYFTHDIKINSNKLYFYISAYMEADILPEVPDAYNIHFLRGVFDGCGYFILRNSFVLSEGLSEKNSVIITDKYSTLGFDIEYYVMNGSDRCIIKERGVRGIEILATLYSRAGLFLPSNYIKFLDVSRITIDEAMMESAHTFAKRSTCIRRKVGCIISNLNKTNIVSIGYNGQASGDQNYCESSLPGKCGCIHAENNALVKGRGEILYCTTLPCKSCAKLIVNSGIKEVYYDSHYRESSAIELFNKSGIKCKQLERNSYKWKLEIAKNLEFGDE